MSITLAAYIVLFAALGLIEVWTLRAIAQEFLRQNCRKRVRAKRQEVMIASRLRRVGRVEDQ